MAYNINIEKDNKIIIKKLIINPESEIKDLKFEIIKHFKKNEEKNFLFDENNLLLFYNNQILNDNEKIINYKIKKGGNIIIKDKSEINENYNNNNRNNNNNNNKK